MQNVAGMYENLQVSSMLWRAPQQQPNFSTAFHFAMFLIHRTSRPVTHRTLWRQLFFFYVVVVGVLKTYSPFR